MRRRPVGTGPFRFVEFKPNEIMKVARNKDYWKKDRPWLHAVEYRVIKNQSTGMLTFVAGDVDVTSPYYFQVPMLRDIKAQVPDAVCQLKASNVQRNVLINREAPPFDNADLRRAVALTVDRKAFIDTLTQGAGSIGGALLAPPEGVWGMPEDIMRKLPGYDPDVAKNREEARKLMAKAGYGPDKRLKIKVTTRNISVYRDPAVILIDQLKQIWIDAELEPIDTTQWYPRVRKRDYAIGMNLTGNGLDEPDQAFYENYVCGSDSNWDGYCKSRDRPGDRGAVARARPGEAQDDGVGHRAAAGRGRRAAGAVPQPFGDVLAPLREGVLADDQFHLQRDADGGCVAG
jgi:peptide/nickel transport system substrate-binding protein